MNKKTPEELVLDIQNACEELGWNVALDESSEQLSGIIIGQLPFVEDIVLQLEQGDNYSIYSSGKESNQGFH